MSGGSNAVEETLSTLQFAERAKRVVVHASVNEKLEVADDARLLLHYKRQIESLKRALKQAGTISSSSSSSSSSSQSATDKAKMRALKTTNQELSAEVEQLKAELVKAGKNGGQGGAAAAEDRIRNMVNSLSNDKLVEHTGWAERYQKWLKGQSPGKKSGMSFAQRIVLTEWAVLLQAEELRRTTEGFVAERDKMSREIASLNAKLAVAKRGIGSGGTSSSSATSSPPSSSSPSSSVGRRGPGASPSSFSSSSPKARTKAEIQTHAHAQEAAARAATAWRTLNDPRTQRDYYYNVETGETTWERPRSG